MTNSSDEKQQKSVFINEAHQKELNEPLHVQGGIKEENQKFLEFVMGLVNDGKIELFTPHSLMNEEVYNTLDEKTQGEVDMEAVNVLTAIRKIKDLYDAGLTDTYQIENLVDKLRVTKEKFEEEMGDVFII